MGADGVYPIGCENLAPDVYGTTRAQA
jgi:hypothetical protein